VLDQYVPWIFGGGCAIIALLFFITGILSGIHENLKQIASNTYAAKIEIGSIATNLQELRDKYAPFRTDY
jgi:hypothetical protein